MLDDKIRVSSEIDAYCTKCRLVTNHRVVAIQAGVIKKVICLTCEGQHNYRPPPGEKKLKGASTKRVKKEMTRSRSEAPQTFNQWLELKAELEDEPRPYRMTESFDRGEALTHPKFGLGFIIKVLDGNKIEVMFEKELKTLAIKVNS